MTIEPNPAAHAADIRSTEFARGWTTLGAGMVGVGFGMPLLINTAGLFVLPMQRDFGWTRSALAIAPIVGIVSAMLMPFVGTVIDRLGPRRVAIGGLIGLAAGFVMLASVPARPIPFYALILYLALVATVTGNVVFCKSVLGWFTRRAGTAIALLLSGVSLFGAATQPVLAFVIGHHGWRAGYMVLACLTFCVALPVVLLGLRDPARQHLGQAPDTGYPVRQALADRRFWMIVLAFGGAAMPIGGVVNQLQPMLLSKGYGSASAAGLVSTFLVLTAVGRLTAGLLFDRFRPAVVAGSFLLAACGGALLLGLLDLARTPWIVVTVAVGLIGLAQGAEGDFIALFTLRIFGLKRFATLFAVIVTFSAIAFALGGLVFSAVFDRFGNYDWAIRGSAVVFLLAAITGGSIKTPST